MRLSDNGSEIIKNPLKTTAEPSRLLVSLGRTESATLLLLQRQHLQGPNFHQDCEFSEWDSPEQKPPERQNEHSSRQGFRFTPKSSTKTGIKLHLIMEQHRIKTQSRVRYRRTGQVCRQDNLIRCRQQVQKAAQVWLMGSAGQVWQKGEGEIWSRVTAMIFLVIYESFKITKLIKIHIWKLDSVIRVLEIRVLFTENSHHHLLISALHHNRC